VFIRAAIMVSLGLSACAATADDDFTFDDASRSYTKGDYEVAMDRFRQLAVRGDTRAQLLIGLAHREGHHVARDPVLAYAWLELAASGGGFDPQLTSDIEGARISLAHSLSGKELLAADRMLEEFHSARKQYLREASEPAAELIYPHGAGPSGKVVPGCAVDPSLAGCKVAGGAIAGDENCRRDFVEWDEPASVRGPGAAPAPTRHRGAALNLSRTTTVVFAVHVDRSGYVCRAALARPSGRSNADVATLETISRWRFTPATHAGVPVESYFVGRLTFVVPD
jgi:TonB family protein